MIHHPVFSTFNAVANVGTGHHVFDFIGSRTDTRYRKGWDVHALAAGRAMTSPLPPPNEHYFDWVATLESVNAARGSFRMAELGAGWAPWLVRAALACRQRPAIETVELVAVEADETHHGWVLSHLADNGLLVSDRIHAVRGAMAAQAGTIRFPRIANPDENYGASTRAVTANSECVEVPAYPLADILQRFSGPVDFLHVDIQGAEYDVLPPALDLLKRQVRAMMVGTHLADDRHDQLAAQLAAAGWVQQLNFPRNRTSRTSVGDIAFGDGFLYFRNPAL